MRGGFAESVAKVAGGTVAAQLIGVAVMPVVARLFSPDAFGVLASYSALLMLSLTICGLRYELAVPLIKEKRESALLFVASIAAVCLFSAVAVVIVVAHGLGLLHASLLSQLGSALWLVPVGILVAGTSQSVRYWAIKEQAYGMIATTTMTQGAGRAAVQIVAGVVSPNPLGLVVSEIVGQGAGVLRIGRLAWRDTLATLHRPRLREVAQAAGRNHKYPLLLGPAALVTTGGLQAPALLLTLTYGPSVAGFYFMTQKLLGLPVQLIGKSLSQVFLGEGARLAHSDPRGLGALFDRIAKKLFLVGLLPAAAIALLGRWAVVHLLGPQWDIAGVFMQWLAPTFLMKLAVGDLIDLALVGRPDLSLSWASARLGLVAAAIIGAHLASLDAVQCIAALGVVTTAGYIAKWLMWRHALRGLVVKFE